MQAILMNTGAAIIFLWGLGHLMPTRSVVAGFGEISPDNRKIITMEWIAEGLTLCFLGVLVALVVLLFGDQPATVLVARACAGMLFLMAGLSAATGARTSVLPMKLCPVVKAIAAALMVAGTLP